MKTKTNSKILAVEEKFGMSLRDVLIKVYSEEGTLQASAKRLGVSQSTVSNWILKCGLVIETKLNFYYLTEEGKEMLAGKTTHEN